MYTLVSGWSCLILIAFAMAVEQQRREQFGCSSFLEPMHWIMTTLFAFSFPWASIVPSSVCLMTLLCLPWRYSVGSYSMAPLATTIVPCLIFSPLFSVDSKLPMYPLSSAPFAFRWTLTFLF